MGQCEINIGCFGSKSLRPKRMEWEKTIEKESSPQDQLFSTGGHPTLWRQTDQGNYKSQRSNKNRKKIPFSSNIARVILSKNDRFYFLLTSQYLSIHSILVVKSVSYDAVNQRRLKLFLQAFHANKSAKENLVYASETVERRRRRKL